MSPFSDRYGACVFCLGTNGMLSNDGQSKILSRSRNPLTQKIPLKRVSSVPLGQ